jgi:hypothetical protein
MALFALVKAVAFDHAALPSPPLVGDPAGR